MTQQTETCAHLNCQCPAVAEQGYCSDYCARAIYDPQAPTPVCGCGHPECEKTVVAVTTPVPQ